MLVEPTAGVTVGCAEATVRVLLKRVSKSVVRENSPPFLSVRSSIPVLSEVNCAEGLLVLDM